MLPDVNETLGRSAFGQEKAEKEKRRDRIIEATMKQGLPAWFGVAFCLRSIKTPALQKEKTRPKLSGS